MATSSDYIQYVCERIAGSGELRCKKMFGEYLIYINEKPILMACDNTVFVKIVPELEELMRGAEVGYPYEGAKEHYVLDIDNAELTSKVITVLEAVTPLPKKRGDKKAKRILFVILQQYADWEAAYISSAITMLGQEQFEIKTVSLTKDGVQSIGGFKVLPDYDVASVPKDYAAVILIGGLSWRNEEASQVKPLAEECYRKGRVLGGICAAAAFLGTAGVLNNVAHTSNGLSDLKRWAGSVYTGEERHIAKQAVRDKNVITANGTAPLEFARELLFALNVASKEKIDGWYNFHKLGCYTATMPEM